MTLRKLPAPYPPPPKRPHTGCLRPKGGLCDCLHGSALTKQQKEDAHVQYAGEHDAMCVMLHCVGLAAASAHVRRNGATHARD